jgi:hypothetical protein
MATTLKTCHILDASVNADMQVPPAASHFSLLLNETDDMIDHYSTHAVKE